jgi:8-oxo-dGTP pyrophosphatase MutT (NUDIX family)
LRNGENEIDCLYREIEEETSIPRNSLTFLRKIGAIEYYKPGIGKDVRRNDFLLMVEMASGIPHPVATRNPHPKGLALLL